MTGRQQTQLRFRIRQGALFRGPRVPALYLIGIPHLAPETSCSVMM